MSGLELRSHDIDRAILSVHRTIPNAAAESCDVNHFRVLGVGDDAMSPLEIEAWYARPMLAPVGGHPGRRLKPRSIKRSEEHTSELQSRLHLVCRLLLEKKKQTAACSLTSVTHLESL